MSPTQNPRGAGMKQHEERQADTKNLSGNRETAGMEKDKPRSLASQEARGGRNDADRKPNAASSNKDRADEPPGTRLSAGDRDNRRDEDEGISRR